KPVASWSPGFPAADAAHLPTEFSPGREPWIAARRSQNDGSDRRRCRNQQHMLPGKTVKRGQKSRSGQPLPASLLEIVCDSCLRKRPYGRVNEFRARRNDGKKERTA